MKYYVMLRRFKEKPHNYYQGSKYEGGDIDLIIFLFHDPNKPFRKLSNK